MHLIVEPGFPYKKKKELISSITSRDGVVSYIITKQVRKIILFVSVITFSFNTRLQTWSE